MKSRSTIVLALALAGLLTAGATAGAGTTPVKSIESNTLGATRGSIHHYDRVQPRTIDYYEGVWFAGGELAEIWVEGDGGTDLDLFVYDENGILIASDTRISGDCYVSFTPLWTGPFRIEIHNLGYVSNGYVLMTN